MHNNRHQITEQITWEAPEFREYKKNLQWYLIFGIISAGLLIYAILAGSLITITTFVLGIVIVYFFAIQKPKNTTYTISSLGVRVNDLLIPYKNIRKFWIIYNPPLAKTLNFETTGYLNNTVSLELGDQDPVILKLYLKRYLLEDLDKEESLTDILARKAKF